MTDLPENPHFASPGSLAEAGALLAFGPVLPADTAGRRRPAIRIHVRDHKSRDLPVDQRTLELHYGSFMLSETRPGRDRARRLALETRYGAEPHEISIAGHDGRSYERGPEVEPDDPDGRMPSVVTWHDGEMHYLIASDELDADRLVRIAESIYR